MRCIVAVIAAACLLCSACGDSKEQKLQAENDDLQSEVSTLQAQLEETRTAIADVKEKAEAAKAAGEELDGEVAGFSDDNWREVVPQVQSATDEVQSAQTDLDSSIEALETAADEK